MAVFARQADCDYRHLSYFNSFADSILAVPHCECNYVPGLLSLGEMRELAAHIAPCPLCIIHASQDAIFPVEAAQGQFEKVSAAYSQEDKSDACRLFIHPGGHAYNIPASLAWFEHWLPQEEIE